MNNEVYFCVVHNAEVYTAGRDNHADDRKCIKLLKAYAKNKRIDISFSFGKGIIRGTDGEAFQIEITKIIATTESMMVVGVREVYHKGWIALGMTVAAEHIFQEPIEHVMY